MQVNKMKRYILIIIMALFLAGGNLFAVDKVKKQEQGENKVKSEKQYQDFIDNNNNGIDDSLERQQKQRTKVEPKREPEQKQEQPKEPSPDSYQPDNSKVKQPDSSAKPADKSKSNNKKAERK